MPGANIAGNTRIGPATYVGMSAVVLDNLTVGGHCVIAAGALVTKDLPDRVQAMGFPAKITKENIAGK
jgi:acetyltransferase-like isoleucine patch superfamily enzyme